VESQTIGILTHYSFSHLAHFMATNAKRIPQYHTCARTHTHTHTHTTHFEDTSTKCLVMVFISCFLPMDTHINHAHGRRSVGGQGDIHAPLLFELDGTPCFVPPPYFQGVDIFVMHNCTVLITYITVFVC